MRIHLPPDFKSDQAYSILLGPGDYYWSDRPSQEGWIVVVCGDLLFGPDRAANSRLAVQWLRERYRPRGGGFHLVGWSANSSGVFDVAMSNPGDFLSVTGVAGMPGPGSESRLAKLKGLQVQFIVGERDAHWRRGSERWHELLKEQGVESILEIVPKAGHTMPGLANEPFFKRMNRLVVDE